MQTSVVPYLMNTFLVLSSLLANSFAVSTEDKKWLLDTLLSLHHELRHSNLPTVPPSPWSISHHVASRPQAEWSSSEDDEELALPSIAPVALPPSRKRAFSRMSSFGLLCCNQPPTRAPRNKRPQYRVGSDRWRRLLLTAIANSYNDPSSIQPSVSPSQAIDTVHPYYTYENGENMDGPHLERRGVQEVSGEAVKKEDFPPLITPGHSI